MYRPTKYFFLKKWSQGHRTRGPKLCEAQNAGSITQRGKFAFNLCPAELWSLWYVPRVILDPSFCALGVLEQCNPCSVNLWQHTGCPKKRICCSVSLTEEQTFFETHCSFKASKLICLMVIFVRSIQQCDHFLSKNLFAGWYF